MVQPALPGLSFHVPLHGLLKNIYNIIISTGKGRGKLRKTQPAAPVTVIGVGPPVVKRSRGRLRKNPIPIPTITPIPIVILVPTATPIATATPITTIAPIATTIPVVDNIAPVDNITPVDNIILTDVKVNDVSGNIKTEYNSRLNSFYKKFDI